MEQNKTKSKDNKNKIQMRNRAESSMARASKNVWKDVKTDVGKPIEQGDFIETVDLCRFFYRTEPIISTVINKLVEIGINDIIISKTGLSENEFRVFLALKPRLLEFCETMAQELLLSGLVVPEIGYGKVDKDEIFEMGIKKYASLTFPVSMWVRDPKTIKINSSLMSDTPTYSVQIPDTVIAFIKNEGKYPDGTEDKLLFDNLKKFYPEFVQKIMDGEKEFVLENKLILRRKYLTDTPYPIPYIEPTLDALQHKRRMRRMDFSIMDKVISAIMHVKVGSDDFPVTSSEEDEDVFLEIKKQLQFRFQSDENLERIFQLITNHTTQISWIFPETEILSQTNRYDDINQEILFGLGFPRVLITGEAQRTGTSDPEIATIAPIKTMDSMRRKILKVVKDICKEVALANKFKAPSVTFAALNLHSFSDFMLALQELYSMAGVSRTSVANYMGYDFLEEVDKQEIEARLIEEKDLPQFGPSPFGGNLTNQNTNKPTTTKDQ